MSAPTLLDAILVANLARASGDAGARAGLVPGTMPFVITCMDPRLVGVLLPALGLQGYDVPQAKFAGGVVRTGDVSGTRSVLAAAIFNMASEVLVIGHTDCRMGKMSSFDIRNGLARLGVRPDNFDGQDPAAWLGTFSGEGQAVRASVDVLRADPRIPPAMPVHGLLYNIQTKRIEVVVRGYEASRGSAAGAAMATPGGMRPGPVDWTTPPPPTLGAPSSFGSPGSMGGRGPVDFGASSGFSAPAAPPLMPSGAPAYVPAPQDVSRGSPPSPPLAPPPASPPSSFPEAPSLEAPHPSPPAPPPAPEPQFEAQRKGKKKRRPEASPFDRAQEMLDRLRREPPR
jgi:carbonic anhydrase